MITQNLGFDNLLFKKITFWDKMFVFFPRQNNVREYFSSCYLQVLVGWLPCCSQWIFSVRQSVPQQQALSDCLRLSGNLESL